MGGRAGTRGGGREGRAGGSASPAPPAPEAAPLPRPRLEGPFAVMERCMGGGSLDMVRPTPLFPSAPFSNRLCFRLPPMDWLDRRRGAGRGALEAGAVIPFGLRTGATMDGGGSAATVKEVCMATFNVNTSSTLTM